MFTGNMDDMDRKEDHILTTYYKVLYGETPAEARKKEKKNCHSSRGVLSYRLMICTKLLERSYCRKSPFLRRNKITLEVEKKLPNSDKDFIRYWILKSVAQKKKGAYWLQYLFEDFMKTVKAEEASQKALISGAEDADQIVADQAENTNGMSDNDRLTKLLKC